MAVDEDKGPLGQKVDAPETYAPHVLFPVARERGRALLGLDAAKPLPFAGDDVWNAYETSWLTGSGVPRRATLEIRIPCTTPNIVESKSLKLYLNSLNFKRFTSPDALVDTVTADVSRILEGSMTAELHGVESDEPPLLDRTEWCCVDDEDVGELPPEALDVPDSNHLTLRQEATESGSDGAAPVTERLVSHLLRTRCPVTSQPDWGSVLIEYHGPPINRAGLLRYVVSLRREIGFHENAVERIGLAIHERCGPTALRVTGRFMRRGGIDINPVRSFGEDVEAALGAPARQLRVPGQ